MSAENTTAADSPLPDGNVSARRGSLSQVVNETTALLGPPRETVEEDEQENWNSSRTNVYRYASIHLTFFTLGMNDACIGALIPYIEPYYNVGYTTVSTLFIVPSVGYLVAALLNNWVHLTIGQRGIAFLGPFCRLLSYIPMALHPKAFWILPVSMMLTGFGNGINDSAWNAWVGNLRNANELLGLIHATYGLGGTVAPLIASAMITKLSLPWYTYYYIMVGLSIVEVITGLSSFWTATSEAYRKKHKLDDGRKPTSTAAVLRTPIPWLISIFLFGYVGAEVCLGGWIPTFMIEVRHASGWLAGIAVTCFWGGFTCGRVVLAFVTGRIGEKFAVIFYLTLAIILELLYWKIPSTEASLTCVILLGFFLGPLFPAAIVAMTKLLPAEQHVVSIGLTAAIGGSGAAVLPFVVGALAEDVGVAVLQPFVLALLVILMGIWLALPGGLQKGGLEQARREGAQVGGPLRTLATWLRAKIAG